MPVPPALSMAPVPAFAGQPLDRADHLRADPARMAELRAAPAARLLVLDRLTPVLDPAGRLTLTSLDTLDEQAEVVFLGLDDDRPLFAQVPDQGDPLPAYARDIWAAIGLLPADELAIYGGARSLVDWHARHRFCPRCGHATRLAKGGWQRNCPACSAQHFPRVDPVAIMLVEHRAPGDDRAEDALLLGRQARFPAGSYSALAGFVEPGESVEEAVAREVFEEAGVRVHTVRYVASQPWPFPSQLMLGCHCLATSRELTIDTNELEDARWFTRAQVAAALSGRGRGEAEPSDGGGNVSAEPDRDARNVPPAREPTGAGREAIAPPAGTPIAARAAAGNAAEAIVTAATLIPAERARPVESAPMAQAAQAGGFVPPPPRAIAYTLLEWWLEQRPARGAFSGGKLVPGGK